MIRILHSVSNMDRAGIETMLMNYYRHIDRDKVQFDFLCNKPKKGAYDDEIRELGGKIYVSPGLNPFKYPEYLEFMKKLFKAHPEYNVIHAHNGALGVYALHAGKVNNIPVRIFHAHGASITRDWKLPLKLFCKSRLKSNINHKWTCGVDAARCYYGNRTVDENDFLLVRNAIEVERFVFNAEVRRKMRNRYNLEGKHIIGHVGRFMTQKNHSFLIDVFDELCRQDDKAVLFLAGDGELMPEMKKKVKKLGLAEKVIFAGNIDNVNEIYQMFDVFVLPSVWEGLPVVGIEAQTASLPCIFSSAVTRETAVTENCRFISLDAPKSKWVKVILSAYGCRRRDNTDIITEAGYNISMEAVKLQNKYIELTKDFD